MKKLDYCKNIKVNVYVRDRSSGSGAMKRTSTTLNYGICKFYFSECLYTQEARQTKFQGSDRACAELRRQWLVAKVQEWVNAQTSDTQFVADSLYFESKLLNLIYQHGYERGLERNSSNLGLDLK